MSYKQITTPTCSKHHALGMFCLFKNANYFDRLKGLFTETKNGKVQIRLINISTKEIMMAYLIVWLLLMVAGGIGGIVICKIFEGSQLSSGYAILLGMIVALLSGIFYQLILMHQDKKNI